MNRKIIIGTRGSDLAMWQAKYTQTLLKESGCDCELKIIQTTGDRTQQWETSFDKIEGKGFFTKELEDALLSKEIDIAVHSHKDVPTESPAGLIIAGVSDREDPSELLIVRKEAVDERKRFSLRENAAIGTSSARRKAHLRAFRPDLTLLDIRGNVPTRVKKLRDGQFDAILLAAAGVERLQLDLSDLHVEKISPYEFVPAPAQGVLAWQCREDDGFVIGKIDGITNYDTRVRTVIERRVLELFDGGCQLPLGVYCDAEQGENDRLKFRLWASHANTADAPLRPYYFETYDTDGFSDEAVDVMKRPVPKSVFITREQKKDDFFVRTLQAIGAAVECRSFIEFRQVNFKELPECEWIFFSSKHAVKFFFRQQPSIPPGVKFGCVGTSTSAELRAHGKRAEFIGQSTDVKLVGKQFASRVGSARALFPVAKDSLQTIQQQMPKKDNVLNLVVYATIQKTASLAEAPEVMVFTSPSNAEAFLKENKGMRLKRVVAMGESTGKALTRGGVKQFDLPQGFDDLNLLRAVLSGR